MFKVELFKACLLIQHVAGLRFASIGGKADLRIAQLALITPNLKDKIMSTYDRLIEKGIGKGIEQGIEQKTIDVIRNCVKNDIKIPMISNIKGLSDQRVIEIIKSLGL